MKKHSYTLLGQLVFESTCYAHDPSAMIILMAQYGAIIMFTFIAPVAVVTFCSVKLVTTCFEYKSKITNLVINWTVPTILALVTTIIFSVVWISRYGFNSILEIYDVTLYFWLGFVAIASIQLAVLFINWNRKKTLMRSKIIQYVSKCYYGEEKLIVVFWFWNVVVFNMLAWGILFVYVFTSFISDQLNLSIDNMFKLDLLKILSISIFIGVIILIHLMFVVYVLWMLISLVRSHKNVNKRIWIYPAGATALAEVCYYGVFLFNIFFK